jgi:hypothetical protein
MPPMHATILAARQRHQGFSPPAATEADYRALFARLQPVAPVYFSRPGDPPSLVHRATFDDRVLTGRWRGRRAVVKGRFLDGTIGYVLQEDLALYATAFCRPLPRPAWRQLQVLEALERIGPLTPRQLKEETGLLNKEIMPALHRLQEAFLVFEDQVDTEWERGWYPFASEWPEVELSPDQWEAAAGEVVRRLLYSLVFATAEMVQDWSGWGGRDTRGLLAGLERAGTIHPCQIPGLGEGWLSPADGDLMPLAPQSAVVMLHKADPLVRAHARQLKARFAGRETLQYLLIDGDLCGAVLGHWRIGPHDVEDIVVELPTGEAAARRTEILQAVAWGYQPPFSQIRRYQGQALDAERQR